jgi:hypothetical protein
MLDGIYSFRITSRGEVTEAIGRVERGVIKISDSNPPYVVKSSFSNGRPCWILQRGPEQGPDDAFFATTGRDATLYNKEGEESEDYFTLEGSWDGEPSSKVIIEGTLDW